MKAARDEIIAALNELLSEHTYHPDEPVPPVEDMADRILQRFDRNGIRLGGIYFDRED